MDTPLKVARMQKKGLSARETFNVVRDALDCSISSIGSIEEGLRSAMLSPPDNYPEGCMTAFMFPLDEIPEKYKGAFSGF